MKFLHLSDLHIGKIVNGFSMLEEQRHVFQQIIKHIQLEQVGVVIVAGDVFDRAVPGVDAVRVFDDFLTELTQNNVAVLLISGNHDSPERISYANRILMDKRLFLCGLFDGKLQKITLPDEFGEMTFWLLPFIKPLVVQSHFGECKIEDYNDAFITVINNSDIDLKARNVLVAHQFFTKTGNTPIRSDSELNSVGGLDAVDTRIIEKFDYVALGHLHGAQKIGDIDHIRYAGSPLKYSFSEIEQTKSVLLVDIQEKNKTIITKELPLTPLHDMREIKGKIADLINSKVSSVGDRNDYLRVVLIDEEEIIDPMGKIRSVYPNVMALYRENSQTKTSLSDAHNDFKQATMAELSPYELFSEFFLKRCGSTMNPEQAKIIRELLETMETKTE